MRGKWTERIVRGDSPEKWTSAYTASPKVGKREKEAPQPPEGGERGGTNADVGEKKKKRIKEEFLNHSDSVYALQSNSPHARRIFAHPTAKYASERAYTNRPLRGGLRKQKSPSEKLGLLPVVISVILRDCGCQKAI